MGYATRSRNESCCNHCNPLYTCLFTNQVVSTYVYMGWDSGIFHGSNIFFWIQLPMVAPGPRGCNMYYPFQT